MNSTNLNNPPILEPAEYQERRRQLGEILKDSIGLVFAGDLADPLHDDFHPHSHFEYLTGISNEPGAILILDPANEAESRRAQLVLKERDPEIEIWDGLRPGLDAAFKKATGISTMMRLNRFPAALKQIACERKKLACLHDFANHMQEVSADLAIFKALAERIPGVEIVDQTQALPKLRSIKSTQEISMMQHAADITTEAYKTLLSQMKPGKNEWDLQETLEHAYKSNGSRKAAYGSIAGSGINSTILHYRANDAVLEDGDIVCIDSGASYQGYACDVSRTYPINGKFSERQKEIYDVVLKAQKAAIEAVKVGATFASVDKAARDIIQEAGYGEYFVHSIGHHLGLDVHDAAPNGKLEVGNVITVEPGIYIADEKIGVRIEDDIVITETGTINLTAAIPKEADEIEALLAN